MSDRLDVETKKEAEPAKKEAWSTPTFTRTDAKDAEAFGPGVIDAAVFS